MKGKWIKKIIILVLVLAVAGFGVYKLFFSNKDGLKSKIEDMRDVGSYYMEANMEYHNGDDIRYYLAKVSYKKNSNNDLFRVSLLDKGINQEQIIIRNQDGVFVLTPALNQVYKFKGDWPMNGAKPYLYQSMLDVFNNEHEISKLEDGYLITSKPDYKNAPDWQRQEMKFSKDLKPIWIHIYDSNNDLAVKVSFIKVEFNPTFSDNYFEVKDNMSQARSELTTTTTSSFVDLPLYPTNAILSATLKEQSVITVNGVNQYILTYEGEENFTIVQYIISPYSEMVVIDVSGEMVDVSGSVGILKDNQLVYEYNGVCYHIYSQALSVSKLIQLANGLEVVAAK